MVRELHRITVYRFDSILKLNRDFILVLATSPKISEMRVTIIENNTHITKFNNQFKCLRWRVNNRTTIGLSFMCVCKCTLDSVGQYTLLAIRMRLGSGTSPRLIG